MIYKCKYCGKEIEIKKDDDNSYYYVSCECGYCDGTSESEKLANEKARDLDSQRWRKFSEEIPNTKDGYKAVIVKIENGNFILIYSHGFPAKPSDYYCWVGWLPIYI